MVLGAGERSRPSSVPGFPPRCLYPARTRRAFTLLEILLALALIGLLSGALVTGAVSLLNTEPQSPEEVFWAASQQARRAALRTQQEVALSFDAKEKEFVVTEPSGRRSFPIPAASRELTIDLLQAQASGGSVLIGGQLVDTRTLPSVSFYPDGTCTPFRVQFRTTGPARVIAIDPWTCAPVLKTERT
ncbi:hypothetical protein Oter_1604 [Opitutus terrae PB90-1]|uniref:Type II secretion system protein H n=1 Tax=Opitutus terrae (strain DSM 11246 / JCM 15787 / PB90-1) TaxID=452637 RepID=B1ZTV5_OPITP|nr:hypothetical protein Oter_1604 [Opitutus terrae PB90-1]